MAWTRVLIQVETGSNIVTKYQKEKNIETWDNKVGFGAGCYKQLSTL